MKYTFSIRMSYPHAMPINKITHSACYTVEMGVRARDLTRITLGNNHTAYIHICLQGIGCVCLCVSKTTHRQWRNHRHQNVQLSSVLKNQNGATIVNATFFFCHYNIIWESDDAGEARGQFSNASLKPRWNSGGSCGYTSGTKQKHFAALSSPRLWWRWLQLQP